MRIISLLFSLILIQFAVLAQGSSKRYDFAKSYFGIDLNYTPEYGTSQFINSEGDLEEFMRNGFVTPAINIGATHFWGFADIYVSINTSNISLSEQKLKTSTSYGVLTGFRVFPFQLTNKKLRPFAGFKFSPFYYEQDNIIGENASITKVKSVLDLGLAYRLPTAYIYAGYNRVLNPNLDIAISRNQFSNASFPSQYFNFGINWMIESTRTSQNDTYKRRNEFFGSTNKYGWFLAIGPSSAFPIVQSEYINREKPFLDDFAMPAIFADVAVGYHFSKNEITTAFSYRPITQYRRALDFSQELKRNSFLVEAYKFLGDYHGFNPFVGGGISYESLQLLESDNEVLIRDEKQTYFTPVISFGWDIRPAQKHDVWLLRTNLRYSPFLNFKVDDLNLSMQHLEFNFIQFVIYPQRIAQMKKGR